MTTCSRYAQRYHRLAQHPAAQMVQAVRDPGALEYLVWVSREKCERLPRDAGSAACHSAFWCAPTCGPMRMDRFNGYFTTPWQYGLTNVRPMAAYKYLYPFDHCKPVESPIALTTTTSQEPQSTALLTMWRRTEEWKCNPETGTLSSVVRTDGALVLMDSRSDAIMHECVLYRLGTSRIRVLRCAAFGHRRDSAPT